MSCPLGRCNHGPPKPQVVRSGQRCPEAWPLERPESLEGVVVISWAPLLRPGTEPQRTLPSVHPSRSCPPGRGRPGGEGGGTLLALMLLPSEQWGGRRPAPARLSAHLSPFGSKLALHRRKRGQLALLTHHRCHCIRPKSTLGQNTRPERPQKATTSTTPGPMPQHGPPARCRALLPGLGPCEVRPSRVHSHLLSFETRNTLRSEVKKSSVTSVCAGTQQAWGRKRGRGGGGTGGRVVVVRLGYRGATRDVAGNAEAPPFLGAGVGAVGHARHILTPAAGPAWSQGALGLSPCVPPPGQGPQQLALGPGNPMGPSMPGSPCGRAKGRGCSNLSHGSGGRRDGVWRVLTCRPFCPGSPGSPMLPLAP